MIKNTQLLEQGYILTDFPLDKVVLEYVLQQNWAALDQHFLDISKKDGQLRNFLLEYLDFETLEHIIAIRRAPEDDDGIWHDDGSRFVGFSLSLNRSPESIVGGELLFKKKNADRSMTFPPQPFGKIVIFLTGIFGYEHKVNAVTSGERIVIAGWCS